MSAARTGPQAVPSQAWSTPATRTYTGLSAEARTPAAARDET